MNSNPSNTPLARSPAAPAGPEAESLESKAEAATSAPREFGGRKDGTEPTRYGDWEKHGRCIDF